MKAYNSINTTTTKKLISLSLLLFLQLISIYHSQGQTSCCSLTIISEIDCMLELDIKCNGNSLDCGGPDVSSSSVSPGPWYVGYGGQACSGTRFNVQPGNPGSPSTSTFNFNNPPCPCDLVIELFGVGYTLTGNTIFDNSSTGHLSDNLGTMGGCCPGGISVTFDPTNCILYITMPNCP